VFKPGDLVRIPCNTRLWERVPHHDGLGLGGYRLVCDAKKDDLVLIIESSNENASTSVLHPEHGVKWISTYAADSLQRVEDV
jgi:hypothetical protein